MIGDSPPSEPGDDALPTSMPSGGGAGRGSASMDTVLLAGSKVISNLSLVILSVASARVLGPAGRGVVVVAITVAILCTLVCNLGTSTALRVLLPRDDEHVTVGSYMSLGALTLVAQAGVATLVAALVLSRLDYDPSFRHFALVGALSVSMLLAHLLFEALLALGRPRLLALAEVTASVVQTVVYLVWEGRASASIRTVLASMAIGYLVGAIVAVFGLLGAPHVRPRADVVTWRHLIRQGRAPLTQNLGQFAIQRFDRLVLGALQPSSVVGRYSVAATCSEFVRLIPLAAGQVLVYRVASGRSTPEQARRGAFLTLVLTGIVLIAVIVLAPTIVRVVFGESYHQSANVIRILAVAELAMTGYQLTGGLLLAEARMGDAARAALFGAGCIVVLDLVLIPLGGIDGAALAAVAGYGLLWFDANRRLNRV